ncbi:hypothetical protein V8E55_012074 [Tylopilus felleus]
MVVGDDVGVAVAVLIYCGQLTYRTMHPMFVCRFLGVHTEDLPPALQKEMKRHQFTTTGSTSFLLPIKRRGMDFAKSYMGNILRGQLLTKEDFKDPPPPIVNYGFPVETEVYPTLG